MSEQAAGLIGLAGGILAGVMGVGGGVLFVPGLAIFLSLSQVDAEATSLVAIVPVAMVGAWRQHGYGNVRVHDALVIGGVSLIGAVGGATLAHVLPERVLRIGFAIFLVVVAVRIVRRTTQRPGSPDGASPGGSAGARPRR